jgi:hypothetical protein
VHYSTINIDLSTAESDDDHLNTNDDTIKDPVIEECSFQRNTIFLPPDIAFQVNLSSEMNKHRSNDLTMFHEVIQCVKAHAIHNNVDYTTLLLSRKQLVQLLTQPTLHSVPLMDGSVASIAIFDANAILIAFLYDPLQMHEENFASTYNTCSPRSKSLSLNIE